jgi:hypothetical protein
MAQPRVDVVLASGDMMRCLLRRRSPGETYLIVEVGGEQQVSIPIGNVLHKHAELDPDGAAGEQKYIQQLRHEVGDWKSKYYDQRGNEMTIGQLQSQVAEANRARDGAVSELAHLRQVITPASGVTDAKYGVLLQATKVLLSRCHSCGGQGLVGTGADIEPCSACSIARDLVKIQEMM